MPSDSYARIRNRRLLIATRIVLTVLFATWIIVGVLNLPADYQSYRLNLRSQVMSLDDLTRLGVSIDVGTLYNWGFHIVQVIAFTAVGLIIFLKRSDDWYALLFAICLSANGIGTINFPPDLHSPLISLVKATIVLSLWLPGFPVISLFPNGRFVPQWARWFLIPAAILALPSTLDKLGYIQGDAKLGVLFFFLVILSVCLGIAFLPLRLRRTTNPTQRLQIKILFAGVFGSVSANCFWTALPLIPILGGSALLTP